MLQFDETTTALLETAYLGADATRRRRMAYDALDPASGDSVVDIGCGNGLLTIDLARGVGPSGYVLGIDPSPDMRAAARKRCQDLPWVQISDGLADTLPIDAESADKCVAVQVLEYVPNISSAIKEAHRVLRRGGVFVAVDTGFKTLDWFTEDEARMARVQHAWDHHYTEPRVAAHWPGLARQAGFGAVEVVPFSFCDTTLRPDGIAMMLMHLMSHYAWENGHMPEDEAKAWFDEQLELATTERFFFSLTYYLMRAIRL
ncbi:MAG: methyltransferase domain-containing protein [Arenibacterium sp.]